MRRWHLIALALLAACEQWKAPQRISKLEDKVEELAGDVAALQGPAARKARQKDRQKKGDEAHGEADAKDSEHGGSGDGDGAAKVSEPASGGDSDKPEKADKGHDDDKGEKADKGHDEDKGDKPEKSDKGHEDKGDKPEKSDKGHEDKGHEDKGDKPEKSDKGHEDKGDKPEKSDKPDKPERGEKRAIDQLNAAVASSLAASKSHDGAKPHWTYDGKTGQANWGLLDPSWTQCADGKEQSPIDIEPHASKATPIAFHYRPTAATVVDNGHTLQVNLAAGSSVEIDGRIFELIQFHFHTPSEHTIAGEHYPLEVHLVHQGPTGKLAVIGVLYDIGAEARPLVALWPSLSRKVGVAEKLPRPFDPTSLLPETRTVFRYNGSLTTPPCSEGVLWNVMRRTMTDGRHHLEQFGEHFTHNARELQPRNDRKIQ